MNYYELFNLAPAPKVEKGMLAKKYFTLQKENHPDFFTQASGMEQEDALQLSSEINKAFAIFQRDDKTLEYFLQYKGVIATDEKYALPPDFLMEVMELNETLDEKDGVTIAEEMADIEKPLLEEVLPLLQKGEADLSAPELEQLKAYYYKKKYLRRILDRLGD